jgi:hypothetical protein
MPLAAQSPAVELQIRRYQSIGALGASARSIASSYLLHVGEPGGQLHAGLQELLNDIEMSEMKIVFESFAANSPVYAQIAKEVGVRADSRWVLTDGKGRLIMQGADLPNAAEMRKAMDAAGIKDPTRLLRDFIRQNPGHLDATKDLLDTLLETAEARTKKTLQLDIMTPAEARRKANDDRSYRIPRSFIFDVAPLEGKTLEPQDDAQIWGAYVAELDTIFANGGWRLLEQRREQRLVAKIPLEATSQAMAQIYRRHLPKIEAALEENPTDENLWRTYGLACAVAGRGSTRVLLERLEPDPTKKLSWPENCGGFDILVAEEKAKGNWGAVAQTLWPRWPKLGNQALYLIESMKSGRPELEVRGIVSADDVKRMMQNDIESMMRNQLAPLLESLIRAGRVSDAETVLLDIAKLPECSYFRRIALETALNCGRNDLHAKWLALEIPTKDKANENDIEAVVKYPGSFMPTFVIANGKQFQEQIMALRNQGPLRDWTLNVIFLGQELSGVMNGRNGLPDGEANWLLVNSDGRAIGSGQGQPTQGALAQALAQSVAPTRADILRRFVLEHPSHYGGMLSLLNELKNIANRKTMEKLGEGAGKDKALLLSGDDDEAIWGEYARMFPQVLAFFMERFDVDINWSTSSALFVHSPKMKALGRSMLPQVEAALKMRPSSFYLWGQWFCLSALEPSAKFGPFRESLAISPLNTPLDCPPDMWLLRLELTSVNNWQMLADVLSWRLEVQRPAYEMDPAAMNRAEWNTECAPLLEAYLRLGSDNEANDLVNLWSASPNWGQIKPSIVNLAKGRSKGDLAERWGRM